MNNLKYRHCWYLLFLLCASASLSGAELQHTVISDNLGKENKRVIQMDGSWHSTAASFPLEGIAAKEEDAARHMIYAQEQLKLRLVGLKKDAHYQVRLTYLSDDADREQAVYIDGKLVREQFTLPEKKIFQQVIRVTREAVEDGEIEIIVEKRAGPNVILSKAELLSDSPGLSPKLETNYYGHENAVFGTVFDRNASPGVDLKGLKITASRAVEAVTADVANNGDFQLILPEKWMQDKNSVIKLSCTNDDKVVSFKIGDLFEHNYVKMVLDETPHDPFEVVMANDGRVFYIERLGKVKMCLPASKTSTVIGELKVYAELDDGLLGLALDPHFDENQWMYLFYSIPDQSENVLSRFTLVDGILDMSSEKIILRVPVQRETPPCHTGGSLAFDAEGNIYISTGDNINPFESQGYSPSDMQAGRAVWDAQSSSADSNDLRGKILRITPQADGSYTIPEGNLFPVGMPKTKPEIYVMGCRNPFRIGINQKTGTLYWGEVGPDALADNPERGSRGYDELNQAKRAGNFGWPHFVADNKAYQIYDFATKKPVGQWDAAQPLNQSPNNKGIEKLPPAQPALIWYPYGASATFPQLGSGGRCIMGGPVYHYEESLMSPNKIGKRYDNSFFFYDWMRGWIMAGKLDENENLIAMERFMPGTSFSRPMDLELGPDGALYLIEWGTNYGGSNHNAQIVRLQPGVNLNNFEAKEPTAEEKEQALIAKFKDVLTDGDVAKGKSLFHSARAGCVACHVSDETGGIIGPSLANIGNKLVLQELLEAVVFPSKRISDEYLSITVKMKNGKTYAGGKGDETEGQLTVRTTDQGDVKLEKSTIESVSKGISPMPPMGEAFSPDDMRHLIAYLASLKIIVK